MEYIQLLSASLTPLIAIVTTYIAIQQYRSNRAKLRHDLYDKRMSIYKTASRFVALCKTEHGPTYELYTEFHLTIKESPFLFDTDLAEYLDNLEQQEAKMAFLKSRIKETTLEDGNKIKTELRDIERWFEKQESLLTSKFMRYLNLKTLK